MTVRSQSDLEALQRVGRLVGEALEHMTAAVRPGITTGELDRIGEEFMRRRGATSAPQRDYDFPGFNCISVNEEIVHGIPGKR
ncbi:MAG TPA: M24 family metallopeptidase, partial [Terriglobales bacterium]|nr:M24 family metallopeptidase [Terriglobales bacterium]